MDSILFELKLPATNSSGIATDGKYVEDFQLCCRSLVGTAKKYPGIEFLSGNVLLLSAKTHLTAFGEILETARQFHLPYRVLWLNDPPQWAESPDYKKQDTTTPTG